MRRRGVAGRPRGYHDHQRSTNASSNYQGARGRHRLSVIQEAQDESSGAINPQVASISCSLKHLYHDESATATPTTTTTSDDTGRTAAIACDRRFKVCQNPARVAEGFSRAPTISRLAYDSRGALVWQLPFSPRGVNLTQSHSGGGGGCSVGSPYPAYASHRARGHQQVAGDLFTFDCCASWLEQRPSLPSVREGHAQVWDASKDQKGHGGGGGGASDINPQLVWPTTPTKSLKARADQVHSGKPTTARRRDPHGHLHSHKKGAWRSTRRGVPKFRVPARASDQQRRRSSSGSSSNINNNNNNSNKVVNCHRSTTITTKAPGSRTRTSLTSSSRRRQTATTTHSAQGGTQRFKRDRSARLDARPAVGKGGAERATGARIAAAAAGVREAAEAAGAAAVARQELAVVAPTTTTTTTSSNSRSRRDPRGRSRRQRRAKRHVVRCDNNNLYHQHHNHYQHQHQHSHQQYKSSKSRPLVSAISSHHHQHHHPHPHQHNFHRASTDYAASSIAASTGRQFRGQSEPSTPLGRDDEPQLSQSSRVLPASVARAPPSSSVPPLQLPLRLPGHRTTTFTPPPPPPPQAPTIRGGRGHKPLQASASYPVVERRADQTAPVVVVALPFTWAGTTSADNDDGGGGGEERSRDSSSTFGGRDNVVGATRKDQTTAGGCQASISGISAQLEAANSNPIVLTKPPTPSSSSCNQTVQRDSSKRRQQQQQPTMTSTTTSATTAVASMTMNNNDNQRQQVPVAPAVAVRAISSQRSRASINHKNQLKPLLASPLPRQSKPLLETPSTPPILTHHRDHPGPRASQPRGAPRRAPVTVSNSPTTGPPVPTNSDKIQQQRGGGGGGGGGGSRAPPVTPSRHKAPQVSSNKHSVERSVAAAAAETPSSADAAQADLLLECEPPGAGSNVHSLESVGQRARMAISIYDPLPAQQLGDESRLPLDTPSRRPPSPCRVTVARPSKLNLNESGDAPTGSGTSGISSTSAMGAVGPRRRAPRRRESLYGDRFLKSPTIPEEPTEFGAGCEKQEPDVASPLPSTSSAAHRHRDGPVQAANGVGFLVATIEPEWGGVAKTLVVHPSSTLESLTQDVLKRLIEIEHEHQSSRTRAGQARLPREKPARRASSGAGSAMGRLQELECEAERLARMFMQNLELQNQQQALATAAQKSDPTAMSRDEQAKFLNPQRVVDKERHKSGRPRATDDARHDTTGGSGGDTKPDQNGNCQSAFDFRCSCCCLHLVNQPKRPDGETWCCCGCS